MDRTADRRRNFKKTRCQDKRHFRSFGRAGQTKCRRFIITHGLSHRHHHGHENEHKIVSTLLSTTICFWIQVELFVFSPHSKTDTSFYRNLLRSADYCTCHNLSTDFDREVKSRWKSRCRKVDQLTTRRLSSSFGLACQRRPRPFLFCDQILPP